MTTADNFFGSDDNHSSDHNDVANPLELLVGEGKKFRTVEDMARGKLESDNFIPRLQEEIKQLREELNSRARLEELVNKLQEKPTPSNGQEQPPREQVSQHPSGLTAEDLERVLTARETKAREEANLNTVSTELEKLYGSNWKQTVRNKIKELGISEEKFLAEAKSAPGLVLQAFRNNRAAAPPTIPTSVVNPLSTTPTTQVDAEWEALEKIRKEDPNRYYSREVQKEVLRVGAKVFGVS